MAVATAAFGLIAWCALALASGGVDFGRPTSDDAAATRIFAISLAAGALLAAALIWRHRRAAVWRSGPLLLAAGGLGALTAWAAASTGWALSPHLAWIEANQLALALVALLVGAALTDAFARTAQWLALGVSAVSSVVAVVALATEALPGSLGSDFDPGRLSAPLDAPNALATIVAMGLPGVLWLAGRSRAHAVGASAWLVPMLTALALTLSRSGWLAAAVAAALALAASPRGRLTVTAGLTGAVCAAVPVAYGLSNDVLTADRVATALRESEGAQLGGLVVAAAVAAALVCLALTATPWIGRGGLVVAAAVGAVAIAPAAVLAGGDPPARDAIANEPDRVLSLSSNNRTTWWGEAVDGWRAHPVVGNGAGSFGLVHLRERDDGEDRFNVRQPHQIVLKMLTDLGVVGLALLLTAAAGVALAAGRLIARGAGHRWALPGAVLSAFVIEAQLDVSVTVPALAVPAFAAAGVMIGEAARGAPPIERVRGETALVMAGTLVSLMLVASALLPALSAERVRAAEDALRAGDTERAVRLSADARDLNPISTAPLDMEASAHRDRGDIAAMVAALRRSTELQPDNARAWRRLAQVLGDLQHPEADAAWARVLELDPRNRRALAALGQP